MVPPVLKEEGFMAGTKWYGTVLLGCLFFGMASGAVIFSDDFSNPGQANLNWLASSASITRTCSNGVYTISNSENAANIVFTTFPSPKPTVLTVSGKFTRSLDSISTGMYICFDANASTGYQLLLSRDQRIQLTKYATSSTGSIIYNEKNGAINMGGTNELKISKKNDSITLFCNGVFIASIRDATPLGGGDVALLITAKTTVVFDDITVTDEWTPPPAPKSCFRDDFIGPNVAWLDYGKNDQKQVAEDYLKITTSTAGSYAYPYVSVDQLNLDTFVAVTAVSHRSGNKTGTYGIFLVGALIQQDVPMAMFFINANRQFAILTYPETTVNFKVSTAIRGAAFETTYYTDTVKVIKKKNAPYRMYVNGMLLDSVAESKVTFSITGAGISVDNGMVVWSDFFQFAPDENICPVINFTKSRPMLSRTSFVPYKSDYLFDPMGRIIRSKSVVGQAFNRVAPGYYIMPDGKNGVVIRR
jgi:hypothetical protein